MFAVGRRLLGLFSKKPRNITPQEKPTPPAITNSVVKSGTPEGLLSSEGIAEIVDFEVGGKEYYEKFLMSPEWPKTIASGVTIACGYDLGHVTQEEFMHDWQDYLDDFTLLRLSKCIGLRGHRARELIPSLRDIKISYTIAMKQFADRTLPKWIKRCEQFWPRWDSLLPMQRTALLSLAFNRGTSLMGPRRMGMQQIVDCLNANRLGPIPNIIRKMAQLHELSGLQKRRFKEAILFENAATNKPNTASASP